MSDGQILVIDVFTGHIVCQASSLAGIITKIVWHDCGLIISSVSGALIRWNIPESLRSEVESIPKLPDFFEVPKIEEEGGKPNSPDHIHACVMNGAAPKPDWIYQEMQADPIEPEDKAEGSGEEEDAEDQRELDPEIERPKVEDNDKIVDSFIRSSFIARRGANLIEMSRLLPSRIDEGVDQGKEGEVDCVGDREEEKVECIGRQEEIEEKEEGVDVDELERLVVEAQGYVEIVSDDADVVAAQMELREVLKSMMESENVNREEVEDLVKQLKENVSELEKFGRAISECGDEVLRLLCDV
jgi:hypothetical protein